MKRFSPQELGMLRAAGVTEEQFEAQLTRSHDAGEPHTTIMSVLLRVMLAREPAPEIRVLETGNGKTGLGLSFQNGARCSFVFDGLSNPLPEGVTLPL